MNLTERATTAHSLTLAYSSCAAVTFATAAGLALGTYWLAAVLVIVVGLSTALCAFAAYKTGHQAFKAFPLGSLLLGVVVGSVFAPPLHARLFGVFLPDEILGWKPRPNLASAPFPYDRRTFYYVSTDADGYRNPPRVNTQGATIEMVLQGDSNGFGFGVGQDEHLCAQLQTILRRSCYNASVPGYDVNQYILQTRHLPVRYRTRILLFNLENDFTMSVLATPYLIRRPYFQLEGNDVRLVQTGMPLVAQIYGLRFISQYAVWNKALAPYEGGSAWGNWIPEALGQYPTLQRLLLRLSPLFYVSTNVMSRLAAGLQRPDPHWSPNDPDWFLLTRNKWPEPYRSYAADFETIFGTYLTLAQNTVVVLKATPKLVVRQVQDQAIERLLARGYQQEDIDRRSLQQLVSSISVRHGATVVDATTAFEQYPDPASLFLSGDAHLSPAGHALMARLVAKAIPTSKRD